MMGQQADRGKKARAVRLIVAALLLAGVAYWAVLVWGPHRVSFGAEKTGESVVFRIQPHNVNGILDVRVVDKIDKRLLWLVQLNYYPGPLLTYGQVPGEFMTSSGSRRQGKQEFPLGDQPPVPFPVGREIVVDVHYQYDTLHPAASSQSFSVIVSPDGQIRSWETR